MWKSDDLISLCYEWNRNGRGQVFFFIVVFIPTVMSPYLNQREKYSSIKYSYVEIWWFDIYTDHLHLYITCETETEVGVDRCLFVCLFFDVVDMFVFVFFISSESYRYVVLFRPEEKIFLNKIFLCQNRVKRKQKWAWPPVILIDLVMELVNVIN